MCFQCVWKKRFVYLQGEQLRPETAGQRAGTSNSAKNQLPGRTSHRRRARAGAGLRCAHEMGSLVVAMATSPSERALLGSDAAGVSACFDMEHGMGPQSREMERNRTAGGEGGLFQSGSLGGAETGWRQQSCPFLGQEPASSKVTHGAESGARKGDVIGVSPKAHMPAGGILPATLNLDGQWVPHHPHTQPVPETGVRTPHTG